MNDERLARIEKRVAKLAEWNAVYILFIVTWTLILLTTIILSIHR